MKTLHGYNISNFCRTRTGFYIGIFSSLISSLLVLATNHAVNFFGVLGPRVLIVPISVGIIYSFLYLLLNRWFWKTKLGNFLFKVPNISGKWRCTGKSYKNISMNTTDDSQIKSLNWEADITIEQYWDSIHIKLVTKTSTSSSIMAAIRPANSADIGHEVEYVYHNEPMQGAPHDMKAHDGFCRLYFSADLQSATGGYFTNARDRISHGTMELHKL